MFHIYGILQKSLDLKIFGFLDIWIFRFLDFWIFGFLGFWIFCVLQLCFQSVETAPKLDSEKIAFVSVFTVFLRGVSVVGGVTTYIYIYMCVHIYTCIYLCVHIFMYLYVYIYIYMYFAILEEEEECTEILSQ